MPHRGIQERHNRQGCSKQPPSTAHNQCWG
jgi:hypothetical protein